MFNKKNISCITLEINNPNKIKNDCIDQIELMNLTFKIDQQEYDTMFNFIIESLKTYSIPILSISAKTDIASKSEICSRVSVIKKIINANKALFDYTNYSRTVVK